MHLKFAVLELEKMGPHCMAPFKLYLILKMESQLEV